MRPCLISWRWQNRLSLRSDKGLTGRCERRDKRERTDARTCDRVEPLKQLRQRVVLLSNLATVTVLLQFETFQWKNTPELRIDSFFDGFVSRFSVSTSGTVFPSVSLCLVAARSPSLRFFFFWFLFLTSFCGSLVLKVVLVNARGLACRSTVLALSWRVREVVAM